MTADLRLVPDPDAADRAALAALQAASWRSAYRGVLPDAFLDAPEADPEGLAGRLAAEWSALRLGPRDLLLTAGRPAAPDAFALVLGDPAASAVVGAAASTSGAAPAAGAAPDAAAAVAGEAPGPDPRPYLDHLHARPEARGGGLGERLLREAARRLPGRPGLWLWVFEVNAGARRFYARLGAREERRAVQAPYGQPQPCLRLGWDAAGLAALAAPPPRVPVSAPH